MNEQKKLAYTVEEAEKVSGLSRSRIYRDIKAGDLKSFTVGRRRMISEQALRDRIAKLEKQAHAA